MCTQKSYRISYNMELQILFYDDISKQTTRDEHHTHNNNANSNMYTRDEH